MWTESNHPCFAINTCRICAISSEVLIPIFGTVEDHKERVDYKIIKYLPIVVRKNDSKPKYICFSCISKLEVCRELHELSRATDFKFNNMLFSAALISKEGTTDSVVGPPPSEGVVLTVELQYNDGEQSTVNATHTVGLRVSPCHISETSDATFAAVPSPEQPGLEGDVVDPLLLFSPDTVGPPDDLSIKGPSGFEDPVELFTLGAAAEEGGSARTVKAFPCTICGKTYRRKSNLNTHMGSHSQVRPYVCPECGARFAARWGLTMHERLHANAFACTVCGKPFPARSKLERHARTHTGERPFACHTCGRAFGDKRNLAGHERIHSDVRPFVCDVCGRDFRVRAHLKEHSRVHSKMAAFTCDICGKRFKWKTNLNIHLKVHSGYRHACMDCGREFSRRSDLSKHRRACACAGAATLVDVSEPAQGGAGEMLELDCADEKPAQHSSAILVVDDDIVGHIMVE